MCSTVDYQPPEPEAEEVEEEEEEPVEPESCFTEGETRSCSPVVRGNGLCLVSLRMREAMAMSDCGCDSD